MTSIERFHDAARRGDTVALKEGAWKDYDRSDDKGMTPAMWAAASGHLEALKILVERGASANRCDYFGRTALHHAAGNGHVGCVVFLIAFGVNIWSLDNNFNTPLDVAAIHSHMTVVSCLDKAAADQMTSNVRAVKKQRESAIRDAERRSKRFQKSQQEMEVSGADGIKLSSSRSFPSYPDSSTQPGTSPSYVSLTLSSRLSGRTAMSELRPYPSNFEADSPQVTTNTSPFANGSPPNVRKTVHSSYIANDSPPYAKNASFLSLLAKKLQRKSRQLPDSTSASGNSSLDLMQTGSSSRKPVGSVFSLRFTGGDPIEENDEVPNIQQARPVTPFRASSQPDLSMHRGFRNFDMDGFDVDRTTQGIEHRQQRSLQGKETGELDTRPRCEQKEPPYHDPGESNAQGKGTENRPTVHGIDDPGRFDGGPKAGNGWSSNRGNFESKKGWSSAANGCSNNNRERPGRNDGDSSREIEWSNTPESLGRMDGRSRTANGWTKDNRQKTETGSKSGNGWNNDWESSGIESRAVGRGGSTLDAFLQAYGLLDYIPVLVREKLDMNSLTLVSDLDLKDLGIPLGPRRVLLDAVARRRTALSNPGRMSDSTF